MKIYLIERITDEYKKIHKVNKTSSRIKCYLITKRLIGQGYITRVACYKYPNIIQYETYYYPK